MLVEGAPGCELTSVKQQQGHKLSNITSTKIAMSTKNMVK